MPHLEISKGRRTNQFHLFGGNNEKSQDPVQGFTGGGFLFDEVALMPQSFVNQAEGRCSDEDAKFWYNCNPEGPYNYINTDYLQKLDQKKLLHLHFLMDDNLSLSQKTRDRYERRWAKGSIFYRRYILGEWCLAEGLVYNMFDISKHVIHDLPSKWSNLVVGVDFGAASVTTYIMLGRAADGPHVGKWLAWKEYYHDATKAAAKTTFEFSRDMKAFLAREGGQWFPSSIEVDPSASPLKVQFKRDGMINMKDADNSVQAGIMDVASALSSGNLLIHDSCRHLIGEIQTYSWDAKAALVGEDKPIKKDDHVLDATRYAIRRIFRKAY
jgi:PBSX family phage terminase large subunit